MYSYLRNRWGIQRDAMHEYLRRQENGDVELWAAGSAVLQFELGQTWPDSDLDLYTNADEEQTVSLVSRLIDLGYREVNSIAQEDSIHYGRSGFMRMNKILDIKTFRRVDSEEITLQLVRVGVRDPRFVIDRFDLTCCSIGFNLRGEDASPLYKSDDFADLARMEMELRHKYVRKYAQGNFVTHRRVAKYEARGFTLLNRPTLYKVMQTISDAILRIKTRNITLEKTKYRFLSDPSYLPGRIIFKRGQSAKNVEGGKYYDETYGTRKPVELLDLYISASLITLSELEEKYRMALSGELDLFALARKSQREKIEQKIARETETLQRRLKTLEDSQDIPSQIQELRDDFLSDPNGAELMAEMDRHIDAERRNLPCNPDDADPIMLTPINEIDPEFIYKRIQFLRGGILVRCYDVRSLVTWFSTSGGPEAWPGDKIPVTRYELMRIYSLEAKHRIQSLMENNKVKMNMYKNQLIQLSNPQGTQIEQMLIRGGSRKKCPANKVRNPKTNRCIKRARSRSIRRSRSRSRSMRRSSRKMGEHLSQKAFFNKINRLEREGKMEQRQRMLENILR